MSPKVHNVGPNPYVIYEEEKRPYNGSVVTFNLPLTLVLLESVSRGRGKGTSGADHLVSLGGWRGRGGGSAGPPS